MEIRRFAPPSVPPLGEKWYYCWLCGEGDGTTTEGRKWPLSMLTDIDGHYLCPSHAAAHAKYDIDTPLDINEEDE